MPGTGLRRSAFSLRWSVLRTVGIRVRPRADVAISSALTHTPAPSIASVSQQGVVDFPARPAASRLVLVGLPQRPHPFPDLMRFPVARLVFARLPPRLLLPARNLLRFPAANLLLLRLPRLLHASDILPCSAASPLLGSMLRRLPRARSNLLQLPAASLLLSNLPPRLHHMLARDDDNHMLAVPVACVRVCDDPFTYRM